jgi:hypothetical protein
MADPRPELFPPTLSHSTYFYPIYDRMHRDLQINLGSLCSFFTVLDPLQVQEPMLQYVVESYNCETRHASPWSIPIHDLLRDTIHGQISRQCAPRNYVCC